jgi:acyl-CoA thioesterase-1
MTIQLKRRDFNLCLITMAAAGLCAAEKKSVILVLGDSLSAEYGLPRNTGWVSLLDQQLASEHRPWTVVNASISGDTTSGGRARLPDLLRQYHPRLVIIELGANDALRGLDLNHTQQNLASMVQSCQQSNAKVLLVGMQVPPNFGPDYSNRFSQLFSAVAKNTHSPVVPFFLKGIADVQNSQQWFQADGIHPVAQAHPIMLSNVWNELKKLL